MRAMKETRRRGEAVPSLVWLALVLLAGCGAGAGGDAEDAEAAQDAGEASDMPEHALDDAGRDEGADGDGDGDGDAGEGTDADEASEAVPDDVGVADDAPADVPPPPCDFAAPESPPPGSPVLWAAPLSGTGADTLGGHGHDDGRGPAGFCAGVRTPGATFYELVAAGFETDVDIHGDGEAGDDPLPVDFWRDPGSFTGFGESGGRVNVYIELVDESGAVLNADTAPDVRIARAILDGPSEEFRLTTKPPAEFQTNLPMVGGGVRYGFGLTDSSGAASDRVINLRLPNNHHVCYVLVFRRTTAP
jgi:hypothetical protein